MTTHYWGDEDFDWEGLREAELYISRYVRRWSHCTIITKEKYGTIRYEYVIPCGRISGYLWNWDLLYRKWAQLGWYVAKNAVFSAIKKWPYLEDEILEDFASDEELVGKEIHDKYWRQI